MDGETGARDTGQVNFERAAMQVGYAAYRTYRVAMVNASGVRLGYFDFVGQPSVESFGGSVTDKRNVPLHSNVYRITPNIGKSPQLVY